MQIFNKKTKFDFMGQRRLFGVVSGAAVLISLALLLFVQPKFGIDFVGGTELQIKFNSSDATISKIRSVLKKNGFEGADVVSFGEGNAEYLLRLKTVSAIKDEKIPGYRKTIGQKLGDVQISGFEFSPGGDKLTFQLSEELPIAQVEAAVKAAKDLELGKVDTNDDVAEAEEAEGDETSRKCESATCTFPYKEIQVYEVSLVGIADIVMEKVRAESWGQGAEKMRSAWVGAKVGKQLRNAGISSIGFAILFIMIYIALRFDMRYSPGAAVALLHDVIITLGILTILQVEVTLSTVAALLTIVGYSLNDTIVVFDRIRENLNVSRDVKLVNVINDSLNQTLSRTILTSVTTLLAVLILLGVGWKTTLRDFSFALAIGVAVGTYSSIYVASPIVAVIDKWFASSSKKA